MFRYYYLLCLLIAIKCTFCYNYISDNNLKDKYNHLPFRKERAYRRRPRLESKNSERNKDLEYVIADSKNNKEQIDVDSFIHKPDEYAIQENALYDMDNQKSTAKLKNYDEYGPLAGINMAEDIKKSEKRPYLNSAEENPDYNSDRFFYKDSMNPRYLNYNPLPLRGSNSRKNTRNIVNKLSNQYEMINMPTNLVHKPEKKCSFKLMKIPFFSHSKNETQKPKKAKKRKFCFNCPKKENKDNVTPIEAIKDMTKKEEKVTVASSNKETDKYYQTSIRNNRKKRDNDYWIGDRERQLKELEEIQKKIDGVEISSAKYQKEQ